jgi:hypothetical protein
MIHAIQHVHGFGDTVPLEARVVTVAELLDVPWVKAWRNATEFYRFSRTPGGRLLMAERDEGCWWWIVARVRGDITQLPEWKPKRPRETVREG